MKYLVTGANGFLGQHLCRYLKSKHVDFRATAREGSQSVYASGDLNTFNRWGELLTGISVIVHAAAKAHDLTKSVDLKLKYQQSNFEATQKLAHQAKAYGVRKFIFISTIKVNGEQTLDQPFTPEDRAQPTDDYGISKMLAEAELLKLHEPEVFDVVIIRPCLVYGQGVKANFKNLMKLVEKGWPLPFGLIRNKRSLVSVDNLVDLIVTCASHPNAGGQIFLVSDGVDLSLPELIQAIAKSMHRSVRLIPVPVFLLRIGLTLIGKKEMAQRLFSNLQVDISKTKRLLNWTPPYSIEQSLQIMSKGGPNGI